MNSQLQMLWEVPASPVQEETEFSAQRLRPSGQYCGSSNLFLKWSFLQHLKKWLHYPVCFLSSNKSADVIA